LRIKSGNVREKLGPDWANYLAEFGNHVAGSVERPKEEGSCSLGRARIQRGSREKDELKEGVKEAPTRRVQLQTTSSKLAVLTFGKKFTR